MDWKRFYKTYVQPKGKFEWFFGVIVGIGVVLAAALVILMIVKGQ